MKVPENRKPFAPWEYIRAPRLVKKLFVQYIYDTENKRGNKISMSEAGRYFITLQQTSRRAEKAGYRKGIWISHDWQTGEWGGYETPFTISGVERRIKKGAHRDVLQGISARSREAMLEEVARRYECKPKRALSILGTCKRSGVLVYHKPTNTWRSWDADEPTVSEIVERQSTTKQQTYWDRFSDMPPVKHDYYALEKSEHLTWIMARMNELGELCDRGEAELIRMRVWNSSKCESKIPWQKLNGQIVGKDYFKLKAEAEEAERLAREAEERKQREAEEVERKAREEAERKQREIEWAKQRELEREREHKLREREREIERARERMIRLDNEASSLVAVKLIPYSATSKEIEDMLLTYRFNFSEFSAEELIERGKKCGHLVSVDGGWIGKWKSYDFEKAAAK